MAEKRLLSDSLSHASKILFNIVEERLKAKFYQHLGEDNLDLGMKKNREDIMALRMIFER